MKYIFYILLTSFCVCREQKFEVDYNSDGAIPITTFGLLPSGFIFVNISSLKLPSKIPAQSIGFSIHQSDSAGVSNYAETRRTKCIIQDENPTKPKDRNLVIFTLNKDFRSLSIRRYGNLKQIKIFKTLPQLFINHSNEFPSLLPEIFPMETMMLAEESKKTGKKKKVNKELYDSINVASIPVESHKVEKGVKELSIKFILLTSTQNESGLYTIYLEICQNFKQQLSQSNLGKFAVHLVERNQESYLTAWEIPLPYIYSLFSLAYLSCCLVWVYVLRSSKSESVLRLHYFMLAVCVLKCVALVVYAIDYHFIGLTGRSHSAWAILFYITYLIKGLLLFTVILLLGSGWHLMRRVFSTKEKRVFACVLGLQLLTNIAFVLQDEEAAGDSSRAQLLTQVFLLVDLACCGAVLFPIVWSIRHLTQAAQVDGKSAFNLLKLQLFRRFYLSMVTYIYVTRIVAYLLRYMVPFNLRWLATFFSEFATLVFFAVTAYTFRPTPSNPYAAISQESQSDSEDEVELDVSMEHVNEIDIKGGHRIVGDNHTHTASVTERNLHRKPRDKKLQQSVL